MAVLRGFVAAEAPTPGSESGFRGQITTGTSRTSRIQYRSATQIISPGLRREPPRDWVIGEGEGNHMVSGKTRSLDTKSMAVHTAVCQVTFTTGQVEQARE